MYLATSLGFYLYGACQGGGFLPTLEVFSPKGLVVSYGLGVFFPAGSALALCCVVAVVLFVLCRLPLWFVLLPAVLQASLTFYVFHTFRAG